MEFKKYQHIERFGTDEVEGIEFGECIIFYKIDGTNSSVWLDDYGVLKAGSRNRELTLDNDNAGFYNVVSQDQRVIDYLTKHPNHRLYMEWLVPHSLKTYRFDAWRKFYVFDVCLDKEDGGVEYLPYDIYKEYLEEFNIDYIPPLAKIKNPTYDSLVKLLDKTGQFLIEDGKGKGEGIVIKNYDYYNKYHRQTWAKIVCNEFKETQHKTMGCPEINSTISTEEKIIQQFCTQSFIEKEYEKICNEQNGWSSKYIPMLLGTVWHEFITEEIWNILKTYKNPNINFKTLNAFLIQNIKEVKSEIFY